MWDLESLGEEVGRGEESPGSAMCFAVALGRLLRLSESWFPVSKMGFIIAGSLGCSGWNEARE